MHKGQRLALFLLRVALGWLFLYAGITKILNPAWSAAGYLGNAKTFGGFYAWLASPANMGWVNFINEWGLTLLGVSLIIGIGVRLSSILGALMMLLYYFPILKFPMVGTHSYLVDEHIIYALVLLFFANVHAGRAFGIDHFLATSPKLQKWFS